MEVLVTQQNEGAEGTIGHLGGVKVRGHVTPGWKDSISALPKLTLWSDTRGRLVGGGLAQVALRATYTRSGK